MDATNMEIPGNEGKNQKYVCVNCGAQVKSIYKVNSPNEIELVQCVSKTLEKKNTFLFCIIAANLLWYRRQLLRLSLRNGVH